ncbi:paeninodin family lasso peptide [Lentibacillus sp. Marseille-P4043]|nr:paeninodin family lasso peptide [Lentibacillus sp. Marseille-P4043]
MKNEWKKPVLEDLSVNMTMKGNGHGHGWVDSGEDSGDDVLGS